MVIGYTTGVYDLFHVGHLNMLRNAKGLCDYLMVGVTTDEAVSYKYKRAIIPFHERMEIVRSIRYVDAVIPQHNHDKFEAWQRLKFDVMFVGDDWYASDRWKQYEEQFKAVDVRIVYFPYTQGTSSTVINETLQALRRGTPPTAL